MALSNKQIVERINEAFARNDVEAFLAHCTEDFVWTMVGSEPVRGKDATRKFMASGPPEPPRFTVAQLIADGPHVAATGDMTMTENGKVSAYSYCDVWTFRGDQVAELRAFVIKVAGEAAG